MQALDNDKHRDGFDTTHCAGALYGQIPVTRDIVKSVLHDEERIFYGSQKIGRSIK
jgi:hypothetical protein